MNNIFQKLPDDLQSYIIPFTYSVQSSELLEDIRSFVSSKQEVSYIYFRQWFDSCEEDLDKCWLVNDLFAFANDYNPTLYGYLETCYTMFSRNIMLKSSHKRINEFLSKLEKETFNKKINVFWGLMTSEERTDFIDIANMKIRIIN